MYFYPMFDIFLTLSILFNYGAKVSKKSFFMVSLEIQFSLSPTQFFFFVVVVVIAAAAAAAAIKTLSQINSHIGESLSSNSI